MRARLFTLKWFFCFLLFFMGFVYHPAVVHADSTIDTLIFVGDQRTTDMKTAATHKVSSVTGQSEAGQHQWINCSGASSFKSICSNITAAIGADGKGKAVVICLGLNDATNSAAVDLYCWPRTKYYVDVPVLDEDGNPVYVDSPVYDLDGNPVYVDDGSGMMVQQTTPVQQFTTEERENEDGFQDMVASWTATGAKVYWASVTSVKEGSGSPSEDDVIAFNSMLKSKLPGGCSWLDIYELVANSNPYFRSHTRYDEPTSLSIFHIIWNTVLIQSPTPEEPEPVETSMYAISSSLTSYMNSVLSMNSSEEHANHTLIEAGTDVGNAGAFLGYGDEDYDFSDFITNYLSDSSSVVDYSGLVNVEGSTNGMYLYARYGALLRDLGLDQYGSEGAFGSTRILPGALMYALYAIGSFIPLLFSFVLKLLRLFNPFQFFGNADEIADGMKAAMLDTQGKWTYLSALTPLVEEISLIYDKIASFSWGVLVPILFVLLAANLLIWHESQTMQAKGRKIAVFLFRCLFFALGVPMAGAIYTNILVQMEDMTVDSKVAATQIVAGTFVDFGAWARNLRLEPQENSELVSLSTTDVSATATGGTASGESVRKLRQTVLELNEKSGTLGSVSLGEFGSIAFSGGSDVMDAVRWNTAALTEEDSGDADVRDRMLSMISRFMLGDFYHASDWESDVSNALNKFHESDLGELPTYGDDDPPDNTNTVYEMYDETTEFDDWDGRSDTDNKEIFTYGEKWVGSTGNFNFFSNGCMGGVGISNGPSDDIRYTKGDHAISNKNGADPGVRGGLSTMSMYNYLSSEFGSNSMVIYSARQTASEYVKNSHYAVNLIGSGVLHILYFANCLALLLILAILGVFYACGMVITDLKRTVKILVAVPGAMMGVLKSIVTFIVTVVMMVLEIIGTMFAYTIVSQFLLVFVTAMETVVPGAMTGTAIGGLFGAAGVVESVTTTLLPLYANLLFTTVVLVIVSGVAVVKFPVVLRVYDALMYKIWNWVGIPMELIEKEQGTVSPVPVLVPCEDV